VSPRVLQFTSRSGGKILPPPPVFPGDKLPEKKRAALRVRPTRLVPASRKGGGRPLLILLSIKTDVSGISCFFLSEALGARRRAFLA